MLVLSYLGLLALIPLFAKKDDAEVQWHAKHGIVLLTTWIILAILLEALSSILAMGLVIRKFVSPILWLLILVIHYICIAKSRRGKRFRLPLITNVVGRWKINNVGL